MEKEAYMSQEQKEEKFSLRAVPELLVSTYENWMANDPFRLSAIVAYYAILSLPALIVIILNLVGAIWGREIVQGEILAQITNAVGIETAESIRLMMVDRGDTETSIFTTIIGIITLIYGSTGVFFQLQASLDEIWGIPEDKKSGIMTILKSRAKSFGFILIIGFLLLTSFIITSLLSTFSSYISNYLPDMLFKGLFLIDFIVSIGFIYLLFATLFKFLPSVRVKWKAVRVGAGLTALLFVVGKYVLAYYFNTMQPGSTYGAAGSIILVMLWVSYSSLILFFGAHFTKVYTDRFIKEKPVMRQDRGFLRSSVFQKRR